VQGQCWVNLAWVAKLKGYRHIALPLLTRFIPNVSNTGKLVETNTLIRAVCQLFEGKTFRELADSWYMQRLFIETILELKYNVIGQVRMIPECMMNR